MKHYLLYCENPYSFAILRPLQAAIRHRGDEARWLIRRPLNDYLRHGEEAVNDLAAAKAYQPRAIFIPGNLVPYFLPGIKVSIFHGFGIDKKGHYRVNGFIDLYCTHGPLTTGPFMELAQRHGHFLVQETGWPKMDALLQDQNYPTPLKITQPTILYAPTFSKSMTSAYALFDEITRLSRQNQWRWVVKFHDLMDKELVEKFNAAAHDNLVIAETDNILPLMKDADVMLTDTSSVVAEYQLLDKPVATFRNVNPGPHIYDFTDPAELEAVIARSLTRPPDLMEHARHYANQMHPYRDGQSSERVLAAVDYFFENCSGLKRKPLNLIRKIKALRAYHQF